ncbi:MAG: aldehyde dehydrogenase domain-containing protein [Olpidium bornovanus]|uniref:Aldehyde dehydrogenase domain-containing protein n=1 Tax=Olpidium bornovanus TaxID=278681 RepID=A0A8H7ZNZ9_9FUNG|nr:MAG: aldehyde dehydrogenase domain-containing protein [Olpidium bornovanus]
MARCARRQRFKSSSALCAPGSDGLTRLRTDLEVPDSSAEDVDAAVKAAKGAFPAWSATPREKRSALLMRVADILESRLMEFARAESRDQGKPVGFASTVDIPRSVKNFRFFASYVLHGTDVASTVDGVAWSVARREPIGVAGLISPWNFVNGVTKRREPCLTYVTQVLCDVLKEAGIPSGVVNMVFGTGTRTGNALVFHPDVKMISFTGGTVTGAKISANSAPCFKKLSLELGGKNANIVFDDCHYETALATSVRAAFANQGEICLCGSRVFVQASVYDRFLKDYIRRASELRVGDPSDPDTFMKLNKFLSLPIDKLPCISHRLTLHFAW